MQTQRRHLTLGKATLAVVGLLLVGACVAVFVKDGWDALLDDILGWGLALGIALGFAAGIVSDMRESGSMRTAKSRRRRRDESIEVNPSTCLMMTGGGVDTNGNQFGGKWPE